MFADWALVVLRWAKTSPEARSFVTTMLELKQEDPKGYRILMGLARAMYLKRNPKRPRDRFGRAMHMRSVSKVRPIDFKRAAMLPAAEGGRS